MIKLLLIGFAGFVGTLSRYWLSDVVQERYLMSHNVRAVIFIGLLGGFTTFSALGLQTFTLLQNNQIASATLNIAASNVLGLLFVWAGYSLAKVVS